MSVVYVLVGHIKTLDCLSVSDAADREGGLNHSINPHASFTIQVFGVYIQYSCCTVRLHTESFTTWKIPSRSCRQTVKLRFRED